MYKNIYLFTGEERYLLHQELLKRKKNFQSKYGVDNFVEIDIDQTKGDQIKSILWNKSLFSEKKLIYIPGYPKDTENKSKADILNYINSNIIPNLDQMPTDHILVFISYSPDKRTKDYKYLIENANIKTFAPLKDKELKNYIHDTRGHILTDKEIDELILLVGTNLFALENEIKKIKYYRESNPSNKNMKNLVYQQAPINVFEIIDNFLFNKNKTISQITQMQQNAEDEFQFLGMLYRGIKNILQIIDCYQHGEKDAKVLASKLKLHPFVIFKNLKIINKLISQKNNLCNMFKQIINLDYQIKSGKIPAELCWFEIKTIIHFN